MDPGSPTPQPVPSATPKQLAYLAYMGMTIRGALSEEEAGEAIRRLESVSDYEQWRQLVEKKNDWHTDRFLLHPGLFAEEFDVYYHKELPEILAAYSRSQAPNAAAHLKQGDVREIMASLSSQNPAWWRSPRRQQLFLAELLQRKPHAGSARGSGTGRLVAGLLHSLQEWRHSLANAMRSWWSKGTGGTT